MNHQPLSWGLLVCTYKREKILPLCIQCALSQSRPPTEIIIVDGSPDWQKTQQSILETFAHQVPNIQWTYVEAEKRGLTLQRNQAIQLATADIVFLIDDDSLMYPTCAEDVMKIYELDSQSMIQGVQPAAAHAPPPDVVIDDQPKETGMNPEVKSLHHGRFGKLKHFLWRHIFLMSSEHLFVPYTGSFPTQSFPTFPENQVSIFPVKLFQGFRMTYRRKTIAKVKFEPALLYYAAGEDLDASYRVSLHGALVEAPQAAIHHFESKSGRLQRFQVTILSVLNQAVCIKKNASNASKVQSKFYVLMSRRILSELCKDILSKRFSLPQVRGLFVGLAYSFKIFSMSVKDLEDWYPQFQKSLTQA